MDIDLYVQSRIDMTDSALDGFLPPEDAPPAEIHRAMRYGVFPGGKRFRALLAISAYETFGKNPEDIMPFACAVELIHSYSLVHDDLPSMDNDDFRRGKPSLHKKFGEAAAVLTGDALLTLAFEIISGALTARFKPAASLRAVHELALSSGSCGMLGGQSADMARSGEFSPAELEYIHLKKTAELIKCSVRIGAMLAGAGENELEKLTDYGINIGLAFQMLDDIQDADAPGPEPNFARGSGVNKARIKTNRYIEKAKISLAGIYRDTETLDGIINYMLASWEKKSNHPPAAVDDNL